MIYTILIVAAKVSPSLYYDSDLLPVVYVVI